MLDKYKHEFEDMHQRIIKEKENPFDVINDHSHILKQEEIGMLGIIPYLSEYIRKRDGKKTTL